VGNNDGASLSGNLKSLMRTGTVKQGLQLFGIVAVGTSVFGLWQDYRIVFPASHRGELLAI
jgi:hypothetical protein